MAKISSHMIICTPLNLISVVILCVAFGVSFALSLLCVLATLSMIAFGGYFGMLMGLKFPKFDWQNENVAVKQGFAVFGAMFGSMLWAFILLVVCIFLGMVSIYLALIAITVVNLAVCVFLNIYFKNGAEREFSHLKQ